MTAAAFVKFCSVCGYCYKAEAQGYARDREELTDQDFIEVFRIYERHLSLKNHAQDKRYHAVDSFGGKTTKRWDWSAEEYGRSLNE